LRVVGDDEGRRIGAAASPRPRRCLSRFSPLQKGDPLQIIFHHQKAAFATASTQQEIAIKHTIRLSASATPGRYSAEHGGRIIVTDSESAIADAAKLIIASGADERDLLHVDCGADVTVAPMPLHRLVAPRRKVLRSEMEQWSRAQRH
jgi:hypothetical protein